MRRERDLSSGRHHRRDPRSDQKSASPHGYRRPERCHRRRDCARARRALKYRVSVQTQLAEGLSPVHGDRVQLQQVMLNLILNAIEAMTSVDDEARELVVSTESSPAEGLLVTVGDSGPGDRPGGSRADFRLLLHDQARRSGDWPLDMPLHHRRPWRTIVGRRASASWRRFPIHSAGARLNHGSVRPTMGPSS